ncbi:hypothetical protein RI367_005212 [Sorochytrium milnesiophthora]
MNFLSRKQPGDDASAAAPPLPPPVDDPRWCQHAHTVISDTIAQNLQCLQLWEQMNLKRLRLEQQQQQIDAERARLQEIERLLLQREEELDTAEAALDRHQAAFEEARLAWCAVNDLDEADFRLPHLSASDADVEPNQGRKSRGIVGSALNKAISITAPTLSKLDSRYSLLERMSSIDKTYHVRDKIPLLNGIVGHIAAASSEQDNAAHEEDDGEGSQEVAVVVVKKRSSLALPHFGIRDAIASQVMQQKDKLVNFIADQPDPAPVETHSSSNGDEDSDEAAASDSNTDEHGSGPQLRRAASSGQLKAHASGAATIAHRRSGSLTQAPPALRHAASQPNMRSTLLSPLSSISERISSAISPADKHVGFYHPDGEQAPELHHQQPSSMEEDRSSSSERSSSYSTAATASPDMRRKRQLVKTSPAVPAERHTVAHLPSSQNRRRSSRRSPIPSSFISAAPAVTSSAAPAQSPLSAPAATTSFFTASSTAVLPPPAGSASSADSEWGVNKIFATVQTARTVASAAAVVASHTTGAGSTGSVSVAKHVGGWALNKMLSSLQPVSPDQA